MRAFVGSLLAWRICASATLTASVSRSSSSWPRASAGRRMPATVSTAIRLACAPPGRPLTPSATTKKPAAGSTRTLSSFAGCDCPLLGTGETLATGGHQRVFCKSRNKRSAWLCKLSSRPASIALFNASHRLAHLALFLIGQRQVPLQQRVLGVVGDYHHERRE